MAYDEYVVDRIKHVLNQKKIIFETKKMIGGLCFMVDDKMCLGTHIDKATQESLLMIRIGNETYQKEKHKEECIPMDFTGKRMKDYAFITADGYDLDDDLEYWIQLCLDFNPIAKSSKKKKK